MRKFALAGAAIFALWATASNGAWADPAKPSVFQSGQDFSFSDEKFSYSDEKIEALQKKLNGNGDTGSGGHFGATVTQGSGIYGGYQNPALPDTDNNTSPISGRR